MVKRLIFDLDDTIIMWDDKYDVSLEKTLNDFNISYDDDVLKTLVRVINEYDDVYDIYKFENFRSMMSKYTQIDLPIGFAERWNEYLYLAFPQQKDLELIDTLEYLSRKYELVILSNWFTKTQTERLKNYGVLKYFKEVIGTDLVSNKPSKEAFLKACGEYDINECIMIGDSLEKDVKGALNAGIRAILYDYKNIYTGDIENIKNISELKNIL